MVHFLLVVILDHKSGSSFRSGAGVDSGVGSKFPPGSECQGASGVGTGVRLDATVSLEMQAEMAELGEGPEAESAGKGFGPRVSSVMGDEVVFPGKGFPTASTKPPPMRVLGGDCKGHRRHRLSKGERGGEGGGRRWSGEGGRDRVVSETREGDECRGGRGGEEVQGGSMKEPLRPLGSGSADQWVKRGCGRGWRGLVDRSRRRGTGVRGGYLF